MTERDYNTILDSLETTRRALLAGKYPHGEVARVARLLAKLKRARVLKEGTDTDTSG